MPGLGANREYCARAVLGVAYRDAAMRRDLYAVAAVARRAPVLRAFANSFADDIPTSKTYQILKTIRLRASIHEDVDRRVRAAFFTSYRGDTLR